MSKTKGGNAIHKSNVGVRKVKVRLTGTGHGWGDSTVKSSGDTLFAQDGAVGVEHVVVLWRVGGWLSL